MPSTLYHYRGWVLGACFLILLVSACQTFFLVVPTVKRSSVDLTFKEDHLLSSEVFTPCLLTLEVYDMGGDLPQVIWSIRSRSESCVRVESIRIGAVPEGFVRVGDALPLQAGGRYRVDAEDGNLRKGAGEFSMPQRN